MAGPGNPFTWLNINNGYVSAAPTVVTGTCVSSSATITGLSVNVTATQGVLVTTASGVLPRLLSASVSNAGSIVLNGTIGVSATQAVTIWNYPVPLGLEMTATIAVGGALSSTSSGYHATGIMTPADFTPASASGPAPLADVLYISGGAVTPTAGGVITGWFKRTFDDVNFESLISTPGTSVPALPRAPDFLIPLDAAAEAIGTMKFSSGDVELPSGYSKLTIQNNAGAILPAGGCIVVLPKALAY